ncbi:S1C family serine protease [Streptomyces fuscigenes]|uniref:S1C family serine protease n=1 Tax=Streptomyces fuscigenes TaxID=1528880 RepID=UPI001F436A2F|nr:trypsin-like peptidase domain-containing protein [Streptomyces fuscigenes]MCF3963862.1 trypsin-like peptidase domain-containing protein [Streptomyces fuscigenes]
MDRSLYPGRPRRPLLPLTAGLCAAALVSGCSAAARTSSIPAAPAARTGSAASGQAAAPPRVTNELQTDYQNTIKNVLPSVVQIEAGNALGSGIVYDDRGHIVTNAHVVGSKKSFRVTVATREQPLTARLVSSFPQQDLAVIKLDSVPQGLKGAKFGTSSKVGVGQIVLAMGSPLGLSSSVTQGIVSAVGRTVTESSGQSGGTGATIANLVQTSAAINPGNSGGALVDLNSEVIGIPTLAATDPDIGSGGSAAPGIGFAIPVSTVKTVADQIIKNGKVTHSGRAALGITGRTVLGTDLQPSGVAIVSTTKSGGARAAGLKAGDIIVRVGSVRITDIASLSEVLAGEKPGRQVTVTYLRGGSSKKAKVKLSEM